MLGDTLTARRSDRRAVDRIDARVDSIDARVEFRVRLLSRYSYSTYRDARRLDRRARRLDVESTREVRADPIGRHGFSYLYVGGPAF